MTTGLFIFIFLIFSIGLSIYFFKRKEISKKNHSGRIRFWIIAILLNVFSFAVIYIAFLFLFIVKLQYFFPDKNFTHEKWIDNPDKRYELIKDIRKSKIINGKTKTEVVSILGESNSNTPTDELDVMVNGLYQNFPDTNLTGVDFVYYIGTKPGMLSSTSYLFIWFENDTVSDFIIRGKFKQ